MNAQDAQQFLLKLEQEEGIPPGSRGKIRQVRDPIQSQQSGIKRLLTVGEVLRIHSLPPRDVSGEAAWNKAVNSLAVLKKSFDFSAAKKPGFSVQDASSVGQIKMCVRAGQDGARPALP